MIKHLGENIFACNLPAITSVSYEAYTKCMNGQKWHLSSHKFPTGTEIWYSVLKDIGSQNFYSLYLLDLPIEYLISHFRVSSTFSR